MPCSNSLSQLLCSSLSSTDSVWSTVRSWEQQAQWKGQGMGQRERNYYMKAFYALHHVSCFICVCISVCISNLAWKHQFYPLVAYSLDQDKQISFIVHCTPIMCQVLLGSGTWITKRELVQSLLDRKKKAKKTNRNKQSQVREVPWNA